MSTEKSAEALDCPQCQGSGTVRAMTTGRGPDDYEYDDDACCPACNGTGSADIRDAVNSLGRWSLTTDITREVVALDDVLRIIDARAALAAPPAAPLAVFSMGPWLCEETGQRFSGDELDAAAFVKYRRGSPPAAPDARAVAPISEGELWSFLRSVMSQGADIWLDHQEKSHALYSIRLDAAASERADELMAKLAAPSAAAPIVLVLLTMLFTGCGGGDGDAEDALRIVNASSYEQTASAGSLTIGVGERHAERQLVSVVHANSNPRIARVTMSAEGTKVQAVGAATRAGLRWEIRVAGLVRARGELPAGVAGKTTYDIDIERGATVEVAVLAYVESAGAAGAGVTWDAAKVTAAVQ